MEDTLHSAEQATKLLQNLSLDHHLAKSGDAPEVMKQHQRVRDCAGKALGDIPNVAVLGSSANGTTTSGAQELAIAANPLYAPSGYASQAFYGGGYDGLVGSWEENPRYANADGMEIPPPRVCGENVSLVYHPGYRYGPQMPYCPYSPVNTPIPTVRTDGQLYGPRTPFQYQGPFYQHISSPIQQGHGSISVATEREFLPVDGTNGNSVNRNGTTMGPGPCHPAALLPSRGPYGRGILPLNIPCHGYRHPRLGSDGSRPGSSLPNAAKHFDGQQRIATTNATPAVASQTTPTVGPVGQNAQTSPMTMGTRHSLAASQRGSVPGSINMAYQSNRAYPHRVKNRRSSLVYAAKDFHTRGDSQSWIAVDKGKHRGRGNGPPCNGNGDVDALSERKRGPRTVRFRNQKQFPGAVQPVRGQNPTAYGSNKVVNAIPNVDQYNQPQFVTEYPHAKFFIVKSYSEDDIHKSIKYGVWASTPKGNKKLDTAYQEAQERTGGCPIFLFFSVNASGQFCGVAEMVGPVDFNKNMHYWQQDKWNGSFLVKWHIIKDVSNSQFRHIILENNENKSVTNSRDTQEVKLEQGTEMLNIFKNCVCETSLLDDFLFYEARQKSMQQKKTKQQQQQHHQPQHQQQVFFQSNGEFDRGHYKGAILKTQDENPDETLFKGKSEAKPNSQNSSNLTSTPCAIDCKTTESRKGIPTQKSCLEDRGESYGVGNDAGKGQ